MQKRNLIIISIFLLIMPKVNACGCGMALEDIKVFNALKETQAYLMINIQDENTYNEMPFFRMVSMEEPYNVTIVFPIDGIPYDVEGKTITASQFLDDYDIRKADDYIEKQSLQGIAKRVGKDFKESSPIVFGLSNGLAVVLPLTFVKTMVGRSNELMMMGADLGAIAHFEFEGGSMDIYDVKSMDTLDALVKQLNLNLTGEVQKLVTKYKDYYVAVLHLKVPSALDEASRNQLRVFCPEQTEEVKKVLQEKTVFNIREIRDLVEGQCSEQLRKLIESVTGANSDVKGTLVDMKFKGTNKFFYPTSIVNSYKYPITDQKYYIKTPSNLDIDLESSRVDKTAIFGSERWYKVTSTKDDIKGKITQAGMKAKVRDSFSLINQAIYENYHGWITFILYLLILTLPFIYYYFKVEEQLTGKELSLTIVLWFFTGLLITSIVMFFKKKWKFALTLLLIWLFLLILVIASRLFFV